MKKTYLALLALSIAGISCKKSSSNSTPDAPKYMDLTAGSTWKYQNTNNLTSNVSLNTRTSTNRDSTIVNGSASKVYHVFTNSDGTPNEYYNITGNDYYTFRSLGAALNNLTVESIYLKDNAAVNTSWSLTVSVPITGLGTVPVTLTYTIAEKGISRTVSSVAYSNVIHVTTTISVPGLPAGTITTDIQAYYAPKSGLIESKYKVSAPALSVNIDQSSILVP